MSQELTSEEYLQRMKELEARIRSVKRFEDAVFQQGPNNESLTVIGRIDRPVDDERTIADFYAERLGEIVADLSSRGRATYFSTGCNINAAVYAVTFSLKDPPKKAE